MLVRENGSATAAEPDPGKWNGRPVRLDHPLKARATMPVYPSRRICQTRLRASPDQPRDDTTATSRFDGPAVRVWVEPKEQTVRCEEWVGEEG